MLSEWRLSLANIKRLIYNACTAVTPRKLYNFLIDADLAAGLKAVKARDGVSESEQIRRALREALVKKGVMQADRRRRRTTSRP